MTTPSCSRFEDEGLARLEAGEELDEHFSTCPDCVESRAGYERLARTIAEAGAAIEPPQGWQDGVWSRLDERRTAGSGRPRRSPGRRALRRARWLAPAAALAAALAAMVWIGPPDRSPGVVTLDVAVIERTEGRRGLEAQPGDRLELRAAAGGRRHAELRVYRGDRQLVLRCSAEPPCRRRGDMLEASWELPSPGSYQSLLLASDAALPPPTAEGLDADAGAALDAGAAVELGEAIEVR